MAEGDFIYEKLTWNDIAYIGILLFVNLLFVADRVLYLNSIPTTPEGLDALNGVRLFDIPAIAQGVTALIWCMALFPEPRRFQIYIIDCALFFIGSMTGSVILAILGILPGVAWPLPFIDTTLIFVVTSLSFYIQKRRKAN